MHLQIDSAPPFNLQSLCDLNAALARLEDLPDKTVVILKRGPKSFVKAERHGVRWSVVKRNGGWWTVASFTAEMTTDYAASEASESREAGSLVNRLIRLFRKPPPERCLTAAQVRTIFSEFFLCRKYSIPQSGA